MSRFIKNILLQFAELSNSSRKTTPECHKVVFMRHGQCEWDRRKMFCGWYDSPLTDQGREEAEHAARLLQAAEVRIHHAFTSCLLRSAQTMSILLRCMDQADVPVERSWCLNERHYGNLTGMEKSKAVELFGSEKIDTWRRSYLVRPPPILNVNPYYRAVMECGEPKVIVPQHESLEDTLERYLLYRDTEIAPHVRKGKTVLIVAHEHLLRAAVKHIEHVPDNGAQYLSIPAAVPFMYIVDAGFHASREVEDALRFFGDEEDVQVEQMKCDLMRAKNPMKHDEEWQFCKN